MKANEPFDYAAKTAELDAILTALQDPATPLDEAMKLHATGKALVKELDVFLRQAENQVHTQLADKA